MADTNQIVNVIRPDGRVVGMPKDAVQRAVEVDGYKPATDRDLRRQDIQEQYGNSFEQEMKAVAQGLAKSLPFGGGKILKTVSTPEAVEARSNLYPEAETLGQVGGIAGQMLAPFPTPLKAISSLGRGAEAAAVFGQNATLPAIKALQSLGNKVSGTALEGAVYGLGGAVNESVLGDKPLTAERAMAALGTGAMWGGGAGLLFGSLDMGNKALRQYATSETANSILPAGIPKTAGEALTKTIEHGLPRFISEKIIDKMEELGVISAIDKASQRTAAMVSSDASAIFKSGVEPYVAQIIENRESKLKTRKEFDKINDELKNVSTNQEMFLKRLEEHSQLIAEHAPEFTSQVQQNSIRAVQFLSSKLPPQPADAPLSAQSPTNDADISTFMKYYNAVENPMAVLKDVSNGTLSKQAVEAISAVHPYLYQSMQSEVLDKMVQNKNPLPYKTKLMLSMFMQGPLVNSVNPRAILANQITMNSPSRQSGENKLGGNMAPTQKGLDKLNTAGRSLTPMQRSNQRAQE